MESCPRCGSARVGNVCAHCGFVYPSAAQPYQQQGQYQQPPARPPQQPYGQGQYQQPPAQQQYPAPQQYSQTPGQQPPVAYRAAPQPYQAPPPPGQPYQPQPYQSPPPPAQPYQQPAPQGYQPMPQYQQPPPGYGTYPPPAPQPKKTNTIITVVVVLILVCAGLGAAFVLWGVTYDPFGDATTVTDGDVVDGTFNSVGTNKFYKIMLEPGDVFTATLSGDSGTDFDLYLYDNVAVEAEHLLAGTPGPDSSETASAVAWENDYYIINVFSYAGTGDFTLSVDITDHISLDDGNDAVGEAVSMTPPDEFTELLNANFDIDDYYEVQMDSGDVLDLFLKVPMNSDFDLYVYDSDGNELAYSYAAYGDEQIRLDISSSGTYYVDVNAWQGAGTYTLIAYGPSGDSDGDGTLEAANALTLGAQITGSLDRNSDRDDYYSVELASGQRLIATMSGPASADFDLWVYDTAEEPRADLSSRLYGSDESVDFVADASGTWYINPYAYTGTGTYSLYAYVEGMSTLPSADAGPDMRVAVDEAASFDGSGSWDDGALTYEWDFGDGSDGTGETASHTYTTLGTYTVELTVTDGDSNSATDTLTVDVVDPDTQPLKYAVVVGVADYEDSGVRDLEYSDDDAISWADYLEAEGYTVHLLIDSEGTQDAILDEIAWMEGVETSSSYCAFIFSGHGDRDTYARESYICPYDYTGHSSGISDDGLADAFADFDSEHIFVFFDSCFSGGFDSVAGIGRYVSQTCSEDTWGLDAPRYSHGLWTYWFLEWGLKSQGYTDLTDCFDAASLKVRADPTSDYGYDEWGTYLGRMTPEEEYGGSGAFEL